MLPLSYDVVYQIISHFSACRLSYNNNKCVNTPHEKKAIE